MLYFHEIVFLICNENGVQAEIRYMRMTERRVLVHPTRGGGGGHRVQGRAGGSGEGMTGGRGQYGSLTLSETALKVVAADAHRSTSLIESIPNHSVAFSSITTEDTNNKDNKEDVNEQGLSNENSAEKVNAGPSSASNEGGQNIHTSGSVADGMQAPDDSHDSQQKQIAALSLKQKRYIDKMIQRGIDAGKDIDKKTIKSLSEEIELLTARLKEIDAITDMSTSSSDVVPMTPGSDKKSSIKSKKHKDMQKDGLEQDEQKLKSLSFSFRNSKKDMQQPYSVYQIQLLYSFLFGGVVVLILSSFMTWMYAILFD